MQRRVRLRNFLDRLGVKNILSPAQVEEMLAKLIKADVDHIVEAASKTSKTNKHVVKGLAPCSKSPFYKITDIYAVDINPIAEQLQKVLNNPSPDGYVKCACGYTACKEEALPKPQKGEKIVLHCDMCLPDALRL